MTHVQHVVFGVFGVAVEVCATSFGCCEAPEGCQLSEASFAPLRPSAVAVAPPSSREAEWRRVPARAAEEAAKAAASQSPTAHGAPNEGAPSRLEWPFSLLSLRPNPSPGPD